MSVDGFFFMLSPGYVGEVGPRAEALCTISAHCSGGDETRYASFCMISLLLLMVVVKTCFFLLVY